MNKWINFAKWNREYWSKNDPVVYTTFGKAFHDSFFDPNNDEHTKCELWDILLEQENCQSSYRLVNIIINKHNMKRWHLTIINKGLTLADS